MRIINNSVIVLKSELDDLLLKSEEDKNVIFYRTSSILNSIESYQENNKVIIDEIVLTGDDRKIVNYLYTYELVYFYLEDIQRSLLSAFYSENSEMIKLLRLISSDPLFKMSFKAIEEKYGKKLAVYILKHKEDFKDTSEDLYVYNNGKIKRERINFNILKLKNE